MTACTTHDSTGGCQGMQGCPERGTCRVRADGWHQWACDDHAATVEARYSPDLAANLGGAPAGHLPARATPAGMTPTLFDATTGPGNDAGPVARPRPARLLFALLALAQVLALASAALAVLAAETTPGVELIPPMVCQRGAVPECWTVPE